MKYSLIASVLSTVLLVGNINNIALADATAISSSISAAPTEVQETFDEAKFPHYIEQLKKKALAEGIQQQVIDEAFANVALLAHIIQSDRNQLETKVTLDNYLKRVLPNKKVQRARQMYQAHREKLSLAAERSGVPASYLLAFWAMESDFGQRQGKEDIISALSTLAFEGRREAFFTRQLMAALHILQQQHITVDKLKGSWAGAMGQCQFMPTSFLTYAVDGDGDGIIDIWDNLDDVFASIANYLLIEGWNNQQGWGMEVKVPPTFEAELNGLEDEKGKTVKQWRALGVVLPKSVPADWQAWIIQPDDSAKRTFMVFNNFRTIMHWNRSTYFAISIGTLAESVNQN